MTAISEVSVTLSEALLGHLHGLAADLEIPFDWFVAGLVCDTIESFADPSAGGVRLNPRGGLCLRRPEPAPRLSLRPL
jgi:hypothetical protein